MYVLLGYIQYTLQAWVWGRNMSVGEKQAVMDKEEEEEKAYKEAFEAFDWNRNGAIPTSVSLSNII